MSFCQLQHCRSLFWQVKPTSYYMLQVRRLHSCVNQSCTLMSVKRSIGIHSTKTQWKLRQHICAALKTKSKPHHAQLSSATQIWKNSHSCAMEKFNVTNLPPAQLHKGWQLRANCWNLYTSKNDLTPLVQTACWFQRGGWFLCRPR